VGIAPAHATRTKAIVYVGILFRGIMYFFARELGEFGENAELAKESPIETIKSGEEGETYLAGQYLLFRGAGAGLGCYAVGSRVKKEKE